MKSALISIQPKWCELIAEGKKTAEVRKTRPKIDVPFKCYIYCTKEKTRLEHIHIPTTYENLILNKNIDFGCQVHFYNGIPKNELCTMLNGKVIGEFVCDRIDNYECELWNNEAYELIRQVDYDEDGDIVYRHGAENNEDCEMLNKACLTWEDIRKYLGNGINNCYAWHITDLKIYDKPKELGEFKAYEKPNCPAYLSGDCLQVRRNDVVRCENLDCPHKKLTRPPQSYMFVEDLGV